MTIEIGTPQGLTASRLLQSRARAQVFLMLEDGILTKPRHCETCGKARKLEGHHANYYEVERVKWLCLSCHRTLHGQLKRAVRQEIGDGRSTANQAGGRQHSARWGKGYQQKTRAAV